MEKDYTTAEFYILDVSTFEDSSKYISILLKNLLFYLSDYKPDIAFINIYYYLFHLIYNILLIVVSSKEKNPFDDVPLNFILIILSIFSKKIKILLNITFTFMKEHSFIYIRNIKLRLNIYLD